MILYDYTFKQDAREGRIALRFSNYNCRYQLHNTTHPHITTMHPQVTCRFNTDGEITAVHYHGTDLRQSVAGIHTGRGHTKTVRFKHAPGAVLSISVGPSKHRDQLGGHLCFQCESSDPFSPWNFTLGVSNGQHHVQAAPLVAGKPAPAKWVCDDCDEALEWPTIQVNTDPDWRMGNFPSSAIHTSTKSKSSLFRISGITHKTRQAMKDHPQGGWHYVCERLGPLLALSDAGLAADFERLNEMADRVVSSQWERTLRVCAPPHLDLMADLHSKLTQSLQQLQHAPSSQPLTLDTERLCSIHGSLRAMGTRAFEEWEETHRRTLDTRLASATTALGRYRATLDPLVPAPTGYVEDGDAGDGAGGDDVDGNGATMDASTEISLFDPPGLVTGVSKRGGLQFVAPEVEKQRLRLQYLDQELVRCIAKVRGKICGAFLPSSSLTALSDADVSTHWRRPHRPLPEYERAADTICLRREWMGDTVVGRQLRRIQVHHDAELKALDSKATFLIVLEAAIRRAYNLGDDVTSKTVLDTQDVCCKDIKIASAADKVYNTLDKWKRKFFAHGLWLLSGAPKTITGADGKAINMDLKREKPITLAAPEMVQQKLSEVCMRSRFCPAQQTKSFNALLGTAYRLLEPDQQHSTTVETKPTSGPLSNAEADDKPESTTLGGDGSPPRLPLDAHHATALQRLYEIVEDYIDDHKEAAFRSAFQEPCRFYFRHARGFHGTHYEGNVDSHANNWYIAYLQAALGVHVPIESYYADNCLVSTVDFWSGLSEEAWVKGFSKPEHFGLRFMAIKALKNGLPFITDHHVPKNQFPKGLGLSTVRKDANRLVDPGVAIASHRTQLSRYLDRFAHFFSVEFFTSKAFARMNSEDKPEHAGFRKACAVLYTRYRDEQGVEAPTLLEHVYSEDYTLDVLRVYKFFVWCGITMPTATAAFPPSRTLQKSPLPATKASAKKAESDAEPCAPDDEFTRALQDINTKLQAAMLKCDRGLIRALMAERTKLREVQAKADADAKAKAEAEAEAKAKEKNSETPQTTASPPKPPVAATAAAEVQSHTDPWACHICSFINKPDALACEMCMSPKPGTESEHGAGEWGCPMCTFLNQSSSRRCDICSTPNPRMQVSQVLKQKRNSSMMIG